MKLKMKIVLKKEDVYDLAIQMRQVVEEMETMNAIYQQQITKDEQFAGEMADAYQTQMQELYKEHQKLIQFYQALSKNLIEFAKDYEDLESSLNTKVEIL